MFLACLSAGVTLDEAMLNAAGALELWAAAIAGSGEVLPAARSLTELKTDPEVAGDLRRFMVALIPFPARLQPEAAQ